jgi:hypothetical protein
LQVTLLYSGLPSFRYMPKSGITGLYGKSIRVTSIYIQTNSGYDNNDRIAVVSLPAFVVACVIDDSHSDWSKVKSQNFF